MIAGPRRARRFALVAALLVLAAPAGRPAAAGTVVLLRSRALAPFDSVAAGFHDRYSDAVYDITLDGSDPVELIRDVSRLRPEAVVAVGLRASLFARDNFPRIPLVHTMVVDPARHDLVGAWITGISSDVPPAQSLEALHRAAPDVRRVGVVVGPAGAGGVLRQARQAARRIGIVLIEAPIPDLAALPGRARELVERVDALWLLADPTVATPEGFRFLLDLSLAHRKPLLVFAEPLVRAGAFAALCPDYGWIGERAAEAVRRIQAGERAGDIPVASLKRTRLVVNLATARAIGRTVPSDAVEAAAVVP
jgi:putative ABC transport system substrate-binding protein